MLVYARPCLYRIFRCKLPQLFCRVSQLEHWVGHQILFTFPTFHVSKPPFFLLFNLSLKSTASASWQRKWVVNWKREKNVEWNMVLLEKITRWIMRFQHFFFQGRLSTLFFSDIDIRYPRIYMQMRKMDIIFLKVFPSPIFSVTGAPDWFHRHDTDSHQMRYSICFVLFSFLQNFHWSSFDTYYTTGNYDTNCKNVMTV